MTLTSEGSHCSGWTLPNFQFGSLFCSTTRTCSLSQLSRPMTYRHYISWKHRLWGASRDYGEYLTPSMCSMAGLATPSSMSGVRRAGLGGSNSDRSGSSRHSGRDLAAEAAKGSPKRREGTKRRRARGATHTVVRRTRAQKIMENVTYVQHLYKE